MTGARDLGFLLHNIEPKHIPGEYVFCSIDRETLRALKDTPLLTFRESEGIAVIVSKEIAEKYQLSFDNTWGLITLSVHSDLEAVGFIAAVTKVLAESKISVNVVSAYYHDHLFVPHTKVNDALNLLQAISESIKK
ncbi:ACT domain-containing protein [Candidatus Thorarchaeota archaeon]|nr:MAG: ACT domain-containing protein [Candidatus Thorarchaeota archaeon]